MVALFVQVADPLKYEASVVSVCTYVCSHAFKCMHTYCMQSKKEVSKLMDISV